MDARKLLYWAPRILAILYILFISIFALDVFGTGIGFWQTLLALFMHLLPSFLIIIATFIAWKWELAGGIILIAISVLMGFMTLVVFSWPIFFALPFPLLVIGALFIADQLIQ